MNTVATRTSGLRAALLWYFTHGEFNSRIRRGIPGLRSGKVTPIFRQILSLCRTRSYSSCHAPGGARALSGAMEWSDTIVQHHTQSIRRYRADDCALSSLVSARERLRRLAFPTSGMAEISSSMSASIGSQDFSKPSGLAMTASHLSFCTSTQGTPILQEARVSSTESSNDTAWILEAGYTTILCICCVNLDEVASRMLVSRDECAL